MASWLRFGGLKVSLRSTEDVYFEIQGIPCVMECKRIQSVERLEERIDKATHQLKQQLRSPGNAALRGFIAVDISKPLLKPEGILRGRDMKEVGQLLKKRLYDFYVKNMRHLASPMHERTVAVFVFSGATGAFPDKRIRLLVWRTVCRAQQDLRQELQSRTSLSGRYKRDIDRKELNQTSGHLESSDGNPLYRPKPPRTQSDMLLV